MRLLVLLATLTALAFPFIATIASLAFGLEGRPREGSVVLAVEARRLGATAGFAVVQASASAGGALLLGVVGAAGLFWAEARSRRLAQAARFAAVLPSAFPPLYAILAWMQAFPSVRGLPAVVAVHALMNGGLAAAALERSARAKIGGMAELALAEGASRVAFWRKAALPLLRSDVAVVALFAFAASFSSFAIPLALGGARAATLELAVYERARLAGDLPGALFAAALQTFFVLAAACLLARARPADVAARPARLDLLAWAPGIAVAAAPGLAILAAMAAGGIRGFVEMARDRSAFGPVLSDLPRLAAGSFAASIGCGLLCLAVWLALAFARPCGALRRALLGYAAPSAALSGLALWIWLPSGPGWALAKIAAGTALVAAPALYRLEVDARLRGLSGQIAAARALGAGDGLIFSRIALPQLWRPACALAGLAALWCWGDFALSSAASDHRATVALASAALMNSYRLDAALALSAFSLAGGLATLGIFVGAGRVARA